MFDKHMVLTRGFQNVFEKGRVVGFQMKIRITYYRGVFLAIIGGFEVTVDGEKFAQDKLRFILGGRTYTMQQLGKAEKEHWGFGEAATLRVLKPGGLKPGMHEVEVVQSLKPSYIPEEFGFLGQSRRKITLVA